MPWSVADVDSFNKGLSEQKKRQWVAIANGVLTGGGSEKDAIMAANGKVRESIDDGSLAVDIQDEMVRNRAVREASGDEHPYGAWKGGSKAAGGRPATAGSARANNPMRRGPGSSYVRSHGYDPRGPGADEKYGNRPTLKPGAPTVGGAPSKADIAAHTAAGGPASVSNFNFDAASPGDKYMDPTINRYDPRVAPGRLTVGQLVVAAQDHSVNVPVPGKSYKDGVAVQKGTIGKVTKVSGNVQGVPGGAIAQVDFGGRTGRGIRAYQHGDLTLPTNWASKPTMG